MRLDIRVLYYKERIDLTHKIFVSYVSRVHLLAYKRAVFDAVVNVF
jgi:hypothetical protein